MRLLEELPPGSWQVAGGGGTGAEGPGLSRLAVERCDMLALIPRRSELASLNVAAAAVACFEIARRRSASESGLPS